VLETHVKQACHDRKETHEKLACQKMKETHDARARHKKKEPSAVELERIYEQIPSMKCIEGCTDCCGPVPFDDEEWSKIKDKKKCVDGSLKCPYSHKGSCEIYHGRPYVCRIFGTVKGVKELDCPHNCKPVFPLTAKRAEDLTSHYMDRKATLRW